MAITSGEEEHINPDFHNPWRAVGVELFHSALMALIRFHLISTGSGRPGPSARKSRHRDGGFFFFTIKGEQVHAELTYTLLYEGR